MKSKVSVIIPNYNASEFIEQCIKSVENQSYKNIEIVIVDDGSTDNSWDIIKYMAQKNSNIICVRQNNLNASIARNKGIELASGKYVLFLDSDDELFENAIELLVNEIEKEDAELAIGNFVDIDIKNNVINKRKEIKTLSLCKNPIDCVGMTPNPSNKLFRLDIIKDKGIYFGNVRIGQDLNFYLKYIVFCNTIKLVDRNIYMWRKVNSSMTNTCNFRIFDIIESFKDVKSFYSRTGNISLYENYIKIIEFRHYYLQMEKQKNFKNKKARKVIVDFFDANLDGLMVKECITFNEYRNDYIKCKIKLALKFIYTANIYKFIDEKFARRR